jgi:hypothetical protein
LRIYRPVDDTADRPKELASKSGSNMMLMEFKRKSADPGMSGPKR